MKRIEGWKIRREMLRLRRQVLALPETLRGYGDLALTPVQRRRHQARFAERVHLHDGARPPGRQAAIYLIYQPNGLQPSSLALCRNLAEAGIAPFVVSNAPLSEADRQALAPHVWKIMQRPNFGYDFGGYQDALGCLLGELPEAEAVIIMNDSIWLDLDQGLVARLLAEPAQVVGLVQESKLRVDQAGRLAVDWQNLQSYFYLVHRGLWQSPAFWRFWQGYRMVSNKKRTIKTGEIGFTKHLVTAEIPHAGLISKIQFLTQIAAKDHAYLAFALRYGVYGNPHLGAARDRLIATQAPSETWRAAALAHIRQTLVQEPLNGSFWVAACDLFGLWVIKKSKDPLPTQMRRAFLAAHEDGAIRLTPEIAAEIAASLHRR